MLLVAAAVCIVAGQAQTPPRALQLSRTIPLPAVSGKFDHFAIDLAGHRLFAAATGNHSVEVIDLTTDKVEQSISGLGKPHGLAWVEATGSLYVADGSLAELSVYKGKPLALAGKIELSDDADDMVYNGQRHLLYVGHGAGAATPAKVAVIDTANFNLVANIPVASHPEALDIDKQGQRIFANIADSSEVAVIDAATNAIAAHWKLTGAAGNVPLAYDSEHRILFLAARTPATLIALDAASGTELSRAPTVGGADDLFYDRALGRIYVIGGAGEVDAYQADGRNKIVPIGVTHIEAGAKTALFVPSQSALYVGAPGVDGHPAEIRVYSTSVNQENK